MDEEGTVVVLHVIYHPDRVVGDHVSQIIDSGCFDSGAVDEEASVVEITVSAFEPKHLLEATLKLRMPFIRAFWITSAVPLARDASAITRIAEHLGNGDATIV